MRAKPTFITSGRFNRHESNNDRWVGEYAKPSDNSLDPDLAELLQTHRAWDDAASWIPPRADVRATLEKLLSLDEAQQAKAIPLVDTDTASRLATGAMLWYRQRTDELPPDWDRVERHEPHVRNEMIRLALDHLNEHKVNGRRSTQQRNIDLAMDLLHYWPKRHGRKPTVFLNADKPSPYLAFVFDCFNRVGRKISYDALIKIIRAAKQKQREWYAG